jgi:hypothetical protein
MFFQNNYSELSIIWMANKFREACNFNESFLWDADVPISNCINGFPQVK